ncbi:DUF1851 domain-containing protein [Chitinimonas viridis]|uniref:DUF1851 domain-containing protein n=1 Tax=Chitinimonas viridis TaxID=664880 RepID=A0ABT8B694_9NEIS|nr:T6SS immunity protein Tdi1 domain-containing protein [Chitinimonas viridis]MDN3577779.1 DUF1851 domain-containing protein [Chitinimonas viridis]
MLSLFFKKQKHPPLYYLINPVSAEMLGPWEKHFPAFKQVIGYSSLGSFFLRNPNSNEYIVLHPYKGAAKSYGSHKSVNAFEKSVLKEPGFEEYVLRPDHVLAVSQVVGELPQGHIYIPQPYPFLGGSDAPETYNHGDVWVFSHIVAQMMDL